MDNSSQKHQTYEFHYATFTMEPYAQRQMDSAQLLKEILKQLSKSDLPDTLAVNDRYKDRKGTTQRELIIVSNRWTAGGTKCYGRIALIKQKPVYLLSGRNLVEELKKEVNKRFIEVSHYVINFPSTGDPIIMFELNSEGPRVSDFEYFIRQISIHYRIAKKISFKLHLNVDYSELDKKITNIFNLTVKLPSTVIRVNEWFSAFRNINEESGFKDLRLEFYYKRIKEPNGKFLKNIKGLSFARNLLQWIYKDSKNIEDIDDLKMSYQTQDSDEILDLDFIKNKTESVLKIPIFDGESIRRADFDAIVGTEFDRYLNEGIPSKLD